jgi:hypothetical protein
MRRSELLRSFTLAAFLPNFLFSKELASGADFRRHVVDGLELMARTFWVPEIANWLDRPGKDLRGHFDGRIG